MSQRCDYPPEIQPAHLYALLTALQPGDAVPPQVYVADYANGVMPDWRIQSREDTDSGLVVLVALDYSNVYLADGATVTPVRQDGVAQLSLFGGQERRYPAVRILSSPRKTLRSQPVEFNGAGAWPAKLCDMVQQATHLPGARVLVAGADAAQASGEGEASEREERRRWRAKQPKRICGALANWGQG